MRSRIHARFHCLAAVGFFSLVVTALPAVLPAAEPHPTPTPTAAAPSQPQNSSRDQGLDDWAAISGRPSGSAPQSGATPHPVPGSPQANTSPQPSTSQQFAAPQPSVSPQPAASSQSPSAVAPSPSATTAVPASALPSATTNGAVSPVAASASAAIVQALTGVTPSPSPAREGNPAPATAAVAGSADKPVVPAEAAASRNGEATAPTSLEQTVIRRVGDNSAVKASAPNPAAVTPPSAGSETFRIGVALAGVIGLILALRWGGRKIFAGTTAGAAARLMQVVGRTAIAPRQQLLLIRVGRRLMVVADSGGHMTSLGQIDDPDEVAQLIGQAATAQPAAPKSITFGKLLRRAVGAKASDEQIVVSGVRDADPTLLDTDDSPAGSLLGFGRRKSADPVNARMAFMDGVEPTSDARRPGDSEDRLARESEAAVEAARLDIQNLRAKLREVTERLTDDGGSPPHAETDPSNRRGGKLSPGAFSPDASPPDTNVA